VGVRHALFPRPALGASWAAGFPTPFSAASGVVGLIAGPFSALRSLNCWVRPLSPLRLVVAPPAYGPGRDTSVTCVSASRPISAGSATAFDSALAPCHGSDLLSLRLPFAHRPSVPFVGSLALWKGGRALPGLTSFPVRTLLLSHLSVSFIGRAPCGVPPEPSGRSGTQ
jgi:hypothetical protein